MIDEFENFSESQQRYINTLLRERTAPASFFVGSRDYGIKTMSTFSDGEENKGGAEFTSLHLDSLYLEDMAKYRRFAASIISRRLGKFGYLPLGTTLTPSQVDNYFEQVTFELLLERSVRDLQATEVDAPYFRLLRGKLHARSERGASRVEVQQEIETIIDLLRVPDHTFVEKLNCFLLYRAWSKAQPLIPAASAIARDTQSYLTDQTASTQHSIVLDKYRADLESQLLRDYSRQPMYVGFEAFVAMSAGVLRNLLVIVKDLYRWDAFYGGRPFQDLSISLKAQRQAVSGAADWFYEDSHFAGSLGDDVHAAIKRLGDLFRGMR